jgi:hypothetical protein
MKPTLYKGSKGVIILFSNSDKEKIEKTKGYYQDIVDYCGDLPLMIIGINFHFNEQQKTFLEINFGKLTDYIGFYELTLEKKQNYNQALSTFAQLLIKKSKINEEFKNLLKEKPKNLFKVNNFIELKLEKDDRHKNKYRTNIYINGVKFVQCKYLAFQINRQDLKEFEHINSIDDMEQKDRSRDFLKLEISPEEEFWGHCSNLQAWADNDYDTSLLHRNLAFPLLKKLARLGDPIAKKVFKKEIISRIEEGNKVVVKYLYQKHYLEFFSEEEIEALNLELKKKGINPESFLII